MRGRPARVVVGATGLAAVGALAIVGTFLTWYEIHGEHSTRAVSGWSMLVDHGFSFEVPIEHTVSHGPTGAVTFVAGFVLLGSAYAAWWLAGPSTRATPRTRLWVRSGAALASVFACLGLVLPLAVPSGEDPRSDLVASMPRTLCLAGLIALGVFVALSFVPRHY